VMKSITLVFGYVTASICWHPIHCGLKKSRKIGRASDFALAAADSIFVSHCIAEAMVYLL
jgi:hypothetical protein